jgi:hypothetical protein
MSNRVGIRELRQQAQQRLETRRRRGDNRGHRPRHPIARIVPLRRGTLDQLVLEGRAVEADGDLLDIADELGLPVNAAAIPSVALAELRADER